MHIHSSFQFFDSKTTQIYSGPASFPFAAFETTPFPERNVLLVGNAYHLSFYHQKMCLSSVIFVWSFLSFTCHKELTF